MSRGWRSALFVAANDSARIEKIHTRGADAVILDLEDAVPDAQKSGARAALAGVASTLAARGQRVAVRINSDPEQLQADLEAAVIEPVQALLLPKVDDADSLRTTIARIEYHEAQQALAQPLVVIAMLESPRALQNLDAIAAVPRLGGLALGTEDFSIAMGVAPNPQSLDLPCRMIALAAAARGLMALALPISIGVFDDDAAYGEAIRLARAIGLTGALCIHPSQVRLLNEGFRPGEAELAEAREIVAAWSQRGERAVITVGKRMIDAPVAAWARQLCERGNS